MLLKEAIKRILHKEYQGEKAWKAFVFWWLAANGYDYDFRRDLVKFVDGKSDGGIDAIAWPLEIQSRKEVLVIQSKYFGQEPTEKDLIRFHEAIAALCGPLDEFQKWLSTCRDDLRVPYRRLREEQRRLRFVMIVPTRINAGMKRSLQQDGIEVHDVDMLANLERNYTEGRTPRLDEIRLLSTTSPQVIAEENGTKVWIFTTSARELGAAFERHDNALFAGNIRYALRNQTATKVRIGIHETIEKYPHELVFSHNGITITGDKIRRQGRKVVMHSATIVNGAQTVSYFGTPRVMRLLARNSARVIIKFIQVDNAGLLNEIESKVAYRSNNQNKVDASDLMIELPSLVSLQRFFRRQGVHLERKKGEQKVRYGELGIPKERLAQILDAVEGPEGAVLAKRKQELFGKRAPDLFSDYDASEATRFEAVAWTRVDALFREAICGFTNNKRRKRAQLAEFAALTAFNSVLRQTGLRGGFLRAMTRWSTDNEAIEQFLRRSFGAIIAALLRRSSRDKKNEPAFYKALESVKPTAESAAWYSRRKVRQYYKDNLET